MSEKKSKVKDNNYICIQAFMVNQLELKGNELLVYALIYGYSQTEENRYTGSLQYIADWLNSSKQTVINTLKSLLEKGLIQKYEYLKNGVKYVEYYASDLNGSQNFLLGYSNNLNGGSQNFLPNNINNNNISNNIERKETINSKEKNLSEAEEVKNLIENEFNNNQELLNAFNEFYKMRDKIKKDSNTAYITRRLINFLKPYNDNEKLEIINQSIINGWKGLFPLKKNNQYNNSNNKIPTIAGTGYESNSYNFEIPRDDEETNKYANMSEDEINF